MNDRCRRGSRSWRSSTTWTRRCSFWAPGSGKTTLLLELARDLLDRAAHDPTHPIPVVFPLSTWAESRRPLAEWLVEELYQRYDVSRKVALEWVATDQILPLLDGLDEVPAEYRAACVVMINAFRKAHDLPLVICSRTAENQALAVPLQLYGAIVVQPLSPQQMDSYLTEIGPAGEAVRQAMGHDPMLWETLDSPLILHIVTVAYAGQLESQPRLSGTLKERRDLLFGAYVDQMFRRRGVVRGYTLQRTVHWLTWLAWQMVRHSQTVFYIERLQVDWLPQSEQKAARLSTGLVIGLVIWLIGGLGGGTIGALVASTVEGLVVGLVVGLVGGLNAIQKDIICVDSSWSLKSLERIDLTSLIIVVAFCLIVGLVVGLVSGLVGGLVGGLGCGLVAGLGGGLGLGLGLGYGLSVNEIEILDFPNQGIHRSAECFDWRAGRWASYRAGRWADRRVDRRTDRRVAPGWSWGWLAGRSSGCS